MKLSIIYTCPRLRFDYAVGGIGLGERIKLSRPPY